MFSSLMVAGKTGRAKRSVTGSRRSEQEPLVAVIASEQRLPVLRFVFIGHGEWRRGRGGTATPRISLGKGNASHGV
jgi:hypothetical protein